MSVTGWHFGGALFPAASPILWPPSLQPQPCHPAINTQAWSRLATVNQLSLGVLTGVGLVIFSQFCLLEQPERKIQQKEQIA